MNPKTSTPNQRLIDSLKDRSISQRKFAGMIGMSTNGFHSIAKGGTRVSRVLALATESLLGVNAEWILTGEGDPELDLQKKIDPWQRLVLNRLHSEDSRIFEILIGEIESSSSPYRNGLDSSSTWSTSQTEHYKGLIESLVSILREFSSYESDMGQAPFRCGLMIISGFKISDVEKSHAGRLMDPKFKKRLARIHDIREELYQMINQSRKSNGNPETM